MKLLPSRLTLILIAGLFAQAAFAADPIATVNGTPIPAARAEMMTAAQMAQGAQAGEQLDQQIREELIRREVLAQAALKAGFDKKDDVMIQLELARQAVLIQAYMQDFMKTNTVGDAEIEAEYKSIIARMGEKEYKPRHVLVETEEEAKSIIAKLKKGDKFEDLAQASIDTGSREKGGDLGWSNPNMFVKPFSDAMVALEKGKFSDTPVKSDFGYHVIMLDDIRDVAPPPLDEVKQQLLQRMQQQKVEQHMLELRAKAEVK